MSRRHASMKRRPIVADTMALARQRAQRVSPADVAMQLAVVRRALAEFMRGEHCPQHWCSLADTVNVAETLSTLGLCSGADADRVIADAQRALADVHTRQRQRGSWTLYADEIDALGWLLQVFATQLAAASYGEMHTAITRTAERMRQALAGNASATTAVVVGELSDPRRFDQATPA